MGRWPSWPWPRPSRGAKTLSLQYVAPSTSYDSAHTPFGKLLISNDGRPIPLDVAREVFVPFFTTKSSGSGIGLSLSRQILLRQGLLLSLAEHPARGFNVTFVVEADGG